MFQTKLTYGMICYHNNTPNNDGQAYRFKLS